MRFLFLSLLLLHAFIHTLGFRQAFNLISVHQFTQAVSKVHGVLWLIATVMFAGTACMVLFEFSNWWVISLPAIILSQYLIFKSWSDAKYGTLVNLTLLVLTLRALWYVFR